MKRTEHSSLFLKGFLLLLCLLLLLVVFLFISTNRVLNSAVESTMYESLSDELASALQYTNLYLEYAKDYIRIISQDDTLKSGDDGEISKVLEEYASNNSIFDNVYICFSDGHVCCGKQYVYDAMQYELPVIDFTSDIITCTLTPPYYSRMVQAKTMALAMRKKDEADHDLLIIGEFKISNLVESIKKIVGMNVSFAVFSDDGELIMYNTDNMIAYHGPGNLSVRPEHALFDTLRAYVQSRSLMPLTYGNIRMLASTVKESGWYMVLMVESSMYQMKIYSNLNRIKTLIVLCFPVVIIVSLLVSRRSSSPVIQLSQSMDHINTFSNIELPARLIQRSDEIGKLTRSIECMLKRIDVYVKREREVQAERSQLERKLLQSQITPHFISNSLSCAVTYLLRDNSQVALSTLRQLIRILNYGVEKIDDTVTLREELEFIKVYCDIFRMRRNNSFELIIDVSDEAMNMSMPKLLLQPPVENALFHGFPVAESGQRVCITSEHRCNQLIIMIWNNGETMDAQEIARLNLSMDEGVESADTHGMGLRNCAARIRLLYGPEYGIRLYSQPNNGFTTCIILPWNVNPQGRIDY